jgi:hypothetical protein
MKPAKNNCQARPEFKPIATVQAEFKESLNKKSDTGRNDHRNEFLLVAARVLDSSHLRTFGIPEIISLGKTFDIPVSELTKLADRWIAHLVKNNYLRKSPVSLMDYPTWERTVV